jgi:hypothetical protein
VISNNDVCAVPDKSHPPFYFPSLSVDNSVVRLSTKKRTLGLWGIITCDHNPIDQPKNDYLHHGGTQPQARKNLQAEVLLARGPSQNFIFPEKNFRPKVFSYIHSGTTLHTLLLVPLSC